MTTPQGIQEILEEIQDKNKAHQRLRHLETAVYTVGALLAKPGWKRKLLIVNAVSSFLLEVVDHTVEQQLKAKR